METSYTQLKEKEVINLNSGKRLGRIIDIMFDNQTGKVQGILLPGDRKLFHKSDDIFVPLQNLYKIGDDVILISNLSMINKSNYVSNNLRQSEILKNNNSSLENSHYKSDKLKSFVRYRRINNNKYN